MRSLAQYVRTIQRGETLKELVEETKARAWVSNAEHAAVRLASGKRIIVKGGSAGIDFMVSGDETEISIIMEEEMVCVIRLYFHTHPRVTGPSDQDLRFLTMLRQRRSYLFEIGGDVHGTVIRPK